LFVSIPESLLNLPKLTGRETSGGPGGEGAAEGIGMCIDEGTYDLRFELKNGMDFEIEDVKVE
jgi:hypothetical protein